MKCPYCAEEIKDEAILCRYCGRDLIFFKPIKNQMSALEKQVAELTASLSENSTLVQNLQPVKSPFLVPLLQKHKPSFTNFGLVILLSALISMGTLFCYIFVTAYHVQTSVSYDTSIREIYELKLETIDRIKNVRDEIERMAFLIFIPITIITPILFGFWLGVKWRGSHLRYYIVLGFLAGIFEVLLSPFLLFLFNEHSLRHRPETFYPITAVFYLFPRILLILVVRSTLGFIAGGLGGDWLERKLSPSTTGKGFAERIARKIITSNHSSNGGDESNRELYKNKVKDVADFISALAPILALIGTIITAYFGYLAVLAKK